MTFLLGVFSYRSHAAPAYRPTFTAVAFFKSVFTTAAAFRGLNLFLSSLFRYHSSSTIFFGHGQLRLVWVGCLESTLWYQVAPEPTCFFFLSATGRCVRLPLGVLIFFFLFFSSAGRFGRCVDDSYDGYFLRLHFGSTNLFISYECIPTMVHASCTRVCWKYTPPPHFWP